MGSIEGRRMDKQMAYLRPSEDFRYAFYTKFEPRYSNVIGDIRGELGYGSQYDNDRGRSIAYTSRVEFLLGLPESLLDRVAEPLVTRATRLRTQRRGSMGHDEERSGGGILTKGGILSTAAWFS